MKISALEHQKQIGALNLDHLKKNKKKNTNQDEVSIKPQGQIPRAVELPPVEIGGKKQNPRAVLPQPKALGGWEGANKRNYPIDG